MRPFVVGWRALLFVLRHALGLARLVLLLALLLALGPVALVLLVVIVIGVGFGRASGAPVAIASRTLVHGGASALLPYLRLVAAVWQPLYRHRRALRQLLTQVALAGAGGACLSFFAVWPVRNTSPWWLSLPLGLAGIAVVLGFSCFQTHEHPRHQPADLAESPDVQDVEMDWETLVASAHLLRSPAAYTSRIVHEVVPDVGYMRIQVTREMALPPVPGATTTQKYYVPLMYVQRGTLVDGLSTHSSDNVRVPVVSSSVARALTFKLLAYLTFEHFDEIGLADSPDLFAALRRLSDALITDASLRAEFESERVVGALASVRGVAPASKSAPQGNGRRAREALEKEQNWKAGLESLLQLWEAAHSTYVVYAEVERLPGTPLSISVGYAKPMEDSSQDESRETVYGSLPKTIRRVFGVLPYVYRFTLDYERATRSYHLRFTASPEQYVSHAEVHRRVAADGDPATPAHLVVARTDDSSTINYAHVYVRPLRNVTNVGELFIRLGMRERPPGVLGVVALVGFVQLVLDGFVVSTHGRLFAGSHDDVAAVLLASPGIVSAWMANQLTPGRLQRMPLTAVGGIAFNGFAALTAVALAVLQSHGIDWSVTVGGLTVGQPQWVALIFVSVVAVGNVILRWAWNTYIYVSRLRRGPVQERYTV